jgi:hypothetical protein
MKHIVGLLLLAAAGWADEIQTKDGKKIEFKSLTDEGDTIELTTPQGTKVSIKKSDFDKYIPTGAKEVPLTGAQFIFDKKRKLETVDLFSRIDLKKNVVSGNYRMVGGKLIGNWDGVNAPKLAISFTPPEEYDLTIVAEKAKDGDGSLQMGLIGGGKQFLFSIDVHKGTLSGLPYVNGVGLLESQAEFKVPGRVFEVKRPRSITFMVRK